MNAIAIRIVVDLPRLDIVNDSTLATWWHVAQANPAPLEDATAGQIAEHVGREIIRRWLKSVPPELWHHQSSHHYWKILADNGSWLPVNGDETNRQWTPLPKQERAVSETGAPKGGEHVHG